MSMRSQGKSATRGEGFFTVLASIVSVHLFALRRMEQNILHPLSLETLQGIFIQLSVSSLLHTSSILYHHTWEAETLRLVDYGFICRIDKGISNITIKA